MLQLFDHSAGSCSGIGLSTVQELLVELVINVFELAPQVTEVILQLGPAFSLEYRGQFVLYFVVDLLQLFYSSEVSRPVTRL